jgi:hypothetical protein
VARERYEIPVEGFASDVLEPPDPTMAERRLHRSAAIRDALEIVAVAIPVSVLIIIVSFGLPAFRGVAHRGDVALRVVAFQAETQARFMRYLQDRDAAASTAERQAALDRFVAEQRTAEEEALRVGTPVPTIVAHPSTAPARRPATGSTTRTTRRQASPPGTTRPPPGSPSTTSCVVAGAPACIPPSATTVP